MGALRTYLETSELATYQKTFPSLKVPTIETQDADGYLKAMTQAVIEQVKYLNTFAGIPLDVLYENIGQKHKASNVAAAAMLKKTGTQGDGLGLISIPGDDEGSYALATVSTASGTGTGETPTPALTIPADLWRAQSNLVEQQNAYLDDIKETFTQKRDEMADNFDMASFTESDTFKALVGAAIKKIIDLITDFIPGVADDVIVDTIASYAPRAIGWGIVWLKKHFTAGAILCERMKEENIQLLSVTASFEMYRLRSDIISQHDVTIQSLLSQVAQVETQLMNNLNPETTTATTEAEKEPVIQCPHTGDFIFAYSRGKMTKA